MANAAENFFDLKGVGRVIVQTTEPQGGPGDLTKASALFLTSARLPILRVNFDWYGPGRIDASTSTINGFTSPIIFIASTFSRADGVTAETTMATSISGMLRILLKRPIETDIQDAVCINGRSGTEPASLSVLTFTDGEY